jgi:hypothetical protein
MQRAAGECGRRESVDGAKPRGKLTVARRLLAEPLAAFEVASRRRLSQA